MFIKYARDDIVGEFDFSVEAGSTQPINDTVRKRQAVEMMQAMAPLVGTVIDPTALARYVLQHAFAVKDPDKFIMQQPAQGAPVEGGGAPEGLPGGVPAGGMPAGGPNGPPVPPELMKQLQNQMGLSFRPQIGNQ
jgi:hypothetical protein